MFNQNILKCSKHQGEKGSPDTQWKVGCLSWVTALQLLVLLELQIYNIIFRPPSNPQKDLWNNCKRTSLEDCLFWKNRNLCSISAYVSLESSNILFVSKEGRGLFIINKWFATWVKVLFLFFTATLPRRLHSWGRRCFCWRDLKLKRNNIHRVEICPNWDVFCSIFCYILRIGAN